MFEAPSLTCIGHLAGRSSAGVGSLVADHPSPDRSRKAQSFSSSSHHRGGWCRGRTEHPGCTPQAPAPGTDATPGDTCAGYIGWSQVPVSCRPVHIQIVENHTSRRVHSPVLPLGTGFLHPAAWKMKLRGCEKVQLHNKTDKLMWGGGMRELKIPSLK